MSTLRPYRHRSVHPVLEIPASSQKNKSDNTILTIPEFATLLDGVRVDKRTRFVFDPGKVHGSSPHNASKQTRRVIMAIGRQAGIFVTEAKPAFAHELRHRFGQRLADAGVTIWGRQAIMCHRHVGTG